MADRLDAIMDADVIVSDRPLFRVGEAGTITARDTLCAGRADSMYGDHSRCRAKLMVTASSTKTRTWNFAVEGRS